MRTHDLDDRHSSLEALRTVMGTRLYVGNIPYSTNDSDLRQLFSQNGRTVTDVKIVTDRETGQSRGFAFVEMANQDEAQAVITELNGSSVGGRSIVVNEARERTPGSGGPRGPGGGGGGRGFGGGGPPRPGFGGGGGPPRQSFGGPPRPGGGDRFGDRNRQPDKDQGRRRNRDRDREKERIRDSGDDDY